MMKKTTRSLFLAATFAGMAALTGCAGNGIDSGASTEPATGATAPTTSPEASAAMPGNTSAMPGTNADSMQGASAAPGAAAPMPAQ